MTDTNNWTLSAPWVWVPHYLEEDNQPGRYFLFRKAFPWTPPSSTAEHQECLVHVSADSRYRLFVNGQSVSFGPCKSYPGKWYYETVDIRPYLVEGENVVSARVLRYSSIKAGSSSIVSSPLPGFMVYSTVENIPVFTDVTWRCQEQQSVRIVPHAEWNFLLGPPFMANNERVEEDPGLRGWQEGGYDDSAWDSAVVQTNSVKMMPIVSYWQLSPRPIPPLPETPCRFDSVAKSDGVIAADEWQSLLSDDQPVVIPAGETVQVDLSVDSLLTAFISLAFSGGAGAHITLLYAECYEKDLGVETAPFPMPRAKSNRADTSGRLYGPRDYYTVTSGQDSHLFEPFWFRCFRYVQLAITTGPNHPLTLTHISLRETSYPLDTQTTLHTGDPELTRMWEISLRTLRNCRHETFEDCPFYEQNQFASDSRLQMLFGYQLSRDDRLARKTLEEFHASRTANGLIVAQYPTGLPLTQIPQFSLYFVFMVHDHMRYFADGSVVRRYLGTIDGILEYFAQHLTGTGLVGRFEPTTWPFVDWVQEWFVPGQIFASCMPPAYHTTGAATINSLLYALALTHAAELCEFARRGDTAAEYRARTAGLRDAVNRHCRRATTPEEGGVLYTDGPGVDQFSQHTQIFAILTETVTGQAAQDLLRRCLALAPNPSATDTTTTTSSSSSLADTTSPRLAQASYAMKFYLFRAAEKTGLYAEVFHTLLQPWRQMMALNLTTWAEDEVNARSDCHGWSACPVNEIVEGVFGVRAVVVNSLSAAGEGGVREGVSVRIEPDPSLVGRADGVFCTPAGRIGVRWDREAGDGKVEVRAVGDFRGDVEVFVRGRRVGGELRGGQVVKI
ncbi:putative rhamnosidase B [Aspergillus saccharolyticus JOP 1030-1]|uniref:Alpha-L-rhamnosidase n=1 Tax=Aspergillus saccharolyticus JOP 1030-1 TaxID=1450539 RepID=A0A318ZQI8_9EURO|nr:alpha-L-rhamnosidase [Aspergillus saccharolyticus JOP 1030-1]PYH49879.1 alpha-L-rhamnosidase [Aspergillus saccharolyticus JOP 1030-1]